MTDWWFFIVVDIVGRMQLALTIIAFALFFIAGLIFLDLEQLRDKCNVSLRYFMRFALIGGVSLLFFAQVMLPSKQAVMEAYIASYIQQGYSLAEIQQQIEAIKVCSWSVTNAK